MTRRHLRGGEAITYSFAKNEETNILHQLGYYDQQRRFLSYLNDRREWMKAVVAQHLGLNSTDGCYVAKIEAWLCGGFNVCIPISIQGSGKLPGQQVVLRFALPYRTGDNFRPGNGDEKIQCEAGTYAWLQHNCPDVPIP
ncbi:uncharacterized protein N7479_003247 [Penicillium vulpinum]|uniref:Uncharacterized protein n=1 Tax=Penicillium vulpinum TaxID=29845 RepID=A0A1V6S439_9EURO|nr:uncharacterized protein N7479_003247 [Penicillium vulpinum]KAJ5963371.1 hypothetical protein N7479_003247 [Penicillium vulpinum]OQE08489.1 hypothetical protein PENVUL_c009G08183 [Penicillium vulpinum]